MVHATRNGETKQTNFLRFGAVPVFGLLLVANAFGQQPSCAVSTNTTVVRSEGLAEPLGEITLTCSGGTAAASVLANLFVTLNANITSRLNAAGSPAIPLTVNTGAGPVAAGDAPQLS